MEDISKLDVKPTNEFYSSRLTPKSKFIKYRKIYILHDVGYIKHKKVYATHLYYVPIGFEKCLNAYCEPLNDPSYNDRANIRAYRVQYHKYNIPRPPVHISSVKPKSTNKFEIIIKALLIIISFPIQYILNRPRY